MSKTNLFVGSVGIVFLFCLIFFTAIESVCGSETLSNEKLAALPYKIVYETCRETDGRQNWELYLINADGSNPVNLTRTPDIDELYPHASPDGTKICFVADELVEKKKTRNVYYMNIDGTGRVKVADNARQPCWSPDSRSLAYLKGEFDHYTTTDYASRGLFIYDLKTGTHEEHANKTLLHLYNISWTPDGNWFIATVHGAMGYKHTNLAVQSRGTNVFDLKVPGCRPDVNPGGNKIVWCPDEKVLWIGVLDLTTPVPEVKDRSILFAASGPQIYQQHADWSPDGRFIAFSRGSKEGGAGKYPVAPGNPAKGWNICVGDLTGKWVEITGDGKHNKEPDWITMPTPGH